jgi:LPS-assembly lipoprotein
MKKILLIVLCSFLVGCGFQLRGSESASIPFESIYISALEGKLIIPELKLAIQSSGKTLVLDKPQDAEAILHIISEKYSKHIWSISGSGRVREFQLRYRVSYRLTDSKGLEIVPPSVVSLSRIMPFADAQVLAKQAEEKMLTREMYRDISQQIIRRLSKIKR